MRYMYITVAGFTSEADLRYVAATVQSVVLESKE
jgi:hypothetical protein